MLKRNVRRILQSFGLDIACHQADDQDRLLSLLRLYQVDMIFDIGAHKGMSARFFRRIGFDGRIVSFEPINAFFLIFRSFWVLIWQISAYNEEAFCWAQTRVRTCSQALRR
ncbi:MAG: hypothetical protein ACYTEQ_07970 [Planctomycetota bacterium]|jgi:hypothetical protein